MGDWSELPRPVAFVLSGGASLGAAQVGMLRALGDAALRPDLVVGTSVGALNGAVLAEDGRPEAAARRLDPIWRSLDRRDVFDATIPRQAWRVLRGRSPYPHTALRRLITTTLRARRFEHLTAPLHVVMTDVLSGHPVLADAGPLITPLLATSAIPGLLPPVRIDGREMQDGGIVANVPIGPAVRLGAASIVVLDAGDTCHANTIPRAVPDGIVAALATALRQRVLLEAPLVGRTLPLVYLPRPCVGDRPPLDFSDSGDLMDETAVCVARFLREHDVPQPRGLVGAPHHHADGAFHPAVLDHLYGGDPPRDEFVPSRPTR